MRFFSCLFAGCLAVSATAQTNTPEPQLSSRPVRSRNQSFYFSWGYNAESYTRSTVRVSQPGLNRSYTLHDVTAHDHKGWDENVFKQELTIPQYSYRIGWMFNEKRGWGVEINFDHTKYIIRQGQTVRLTGNLGDGKQVDTNILFTEANGFFYYLNNGANFFLINAVKRFPVWENKKQNLRIDALAKAGIGPVVPHVENSFFGAKNDPHFQIGGWNTGVEADVKVTAFRHVYLEGGVKGDYARYSGLRIHEGTARQAFGSFIFIFSLGVQI